METPSLATPYENSTHAAGRVAQPQARQMTSTQCTAMFLTKLREISEKWCQAKAATARRMVADCWHEYSMNFNEMHLYWDVVDSVDGMFYTGILYRVDGMLYNGMFWDVGGMLLGYIANYIPPGCVWKHGIPPEMQFNQAMTKQYSEFLGAPYVLICSGICEHTVTVANRYVVEYATRTNY